MYASGSLNFKKEQTNVYLKYSVTTIPLFTRYVHLYMKSALLIKLVIVGTYEH